MALCLTSCNFALPDKVLDLAEGNPFLERRVLSAPGYDNSAFSYLYFSDAHVNRESHQGSKVSRYDDNFFSFADAGDYRFAISGGDLSDDGEVNENLFDFTSRFVLHDLFLVEAVGNHDRHSFDYRGNKVWQRFWHQLLFLDNNWKDYYQYLYEGRNSTGCYTYGDVLSIYVLDTSMRTFSSRQLDYLEEALQKDTSRYRIIVSHDNIITGGALDQSLFMTGYADLAEITRYLEILEKHKVSLVLSGHHHKGNILYKGTVPEFNVSAYHRYDSITESQGWWYTISIDPVTEKLAINCYFAETSELRNTITLPLKRN